ncbi:MAG TPA: YceI family protein, partial [Gemmatimonadaceae bacterium]|nr:YceI family protein [Gemmatimonadaceae bacterium]
MKSLSFAAFAFAAASSLAAQPKSASTANPSAQSYIVAPDGNEARYRVREQLAGFDLPKDAIGATKEVKGRIVVGPDGKVVKESSRVTIDLASLKSDQSRRDNFLRRSTLETSKYPQAELVPVALEGLLLPIAPGSSQTFSVRGDLTVHGATHPTTWQVTARGEGNSIVGTATTAFTFKDLGLEQPKVPVVLSVADTIRLEYD